MSDFYKDMQSLASDVLTEFKQGVIQYIKITPGTGPRSNPGPPIETPYNVNGVARGVKFRYIDGTNIVGTDLQVTIPFDTRFVPEMNGFVKIDGVKHKIVGIIPIPPAGTVVANTIIIRK